MKRGIPYRGKQGREQGKWEFLHRSDVPSEYVMAHRNGDDEAIRRDMHLELMNQDQQAPVNIRAMMTDEEYFAMWDAIDTKGLFRNGKLTAEGLARTFEDGDIIHLS